MFSWDLAISISIFLVVLAVIYYLWDSTMFEIQHSKMINEMEGLSVEVSEQLLRTTGIPANWTESDVAVVGLADDRPRVLNSTKIYNFVNMMNANYSNNRYLLGTRAYDFYFNMTYLNGTQVEIDGTPCFTGRSHAGENVSDMVTATRTSILDGEIIRIRFTLWKREL